MMWIILYLGALFASANQSASPSSASEVLEKIAQKRSSFSPFPKVTIEQAYCELGEKFLSIKNNLAPDYDEISCFKFHKQFFRGDKIIATIGRHAGRIYNQNHERKGRNILLGWKKLVEKQMTAIFYYSYKGEHKISQVYDFGEDDAGFRHICVLKAFEKNSIKKLRSTEKKDKKQTSLSPPPNSFLGKILEKEGQK
jgi:hypothetical protein